MKVKAIMNFNDLKENKPRKIGDEFECSKERAYFLVENNAVEIIDDVTVIKIDNPYILKAEDFKEAEGNKSSKPKKNKKK